jgi:hypothetical protein
LSVRRSDVDQPDLSSVHQTWILRSADVLLLDDGLLVAAGFADLATRPPDHVCFAEGVHTRFGLPRELRTWLSESRLRRPCAADIGDGAQQGRSSPPAPHTAGNSPLPMAVELDQEEGREGHR